MAKVGLCIGINEYAVKPLDGAVNDAEDWKAALEGRGFTVEKLLNSKATKNAIVKKMKSAIAEAVAGDRLVFTYSGHGTWIADKDEDEEQDDRDEALVPFDGADGEASLISDDELFDIFNKAKEGVRLVFLVDSCSSGTVNEALTPHDPVVLRKSRFLHPRNVLKDEELRRAIAVENVPSAGKSRESTALLISACEDGQAESEELAVDGRSNGAFTRVALDLLEEEEPETYAAWHELMRPALDELEASSGLEFPQKPQINGTAVQKKWVVLE